MYGRRPSGKDLSSPLEELLEWDDRRRLARRETEQRRAERNALTKEVERLLRQGDAEGGERVKEQVRGIGSELALLEAELAEAERRCGELLLEAPNPVSADTPIGPDDSANVELRRHGTPPVFGFRARDHVELGELHDILDLPRGVKAGGPPAAMC
ncbi:hypothetical protein ACFSQ7_48820 [Paenibacillus rhizoplanae]